MTYQIDQIAQQEHPEIGVRVTEISRAYIYEGFAEWYKECEELKSLYYKSRKDLDYVVFKKYHKQDLTPIQAVRYYFL